MSKAQQEQPDRIPTAEEALSALSNTQSLEALRAENSALRARMEQMAGLQIETNGDGLIAEPTERWVVNHTMVGGKNQATGEFGFRRGEEFFPPPGCDIGRMVRVGAIRPMGAREFNRPVVRVADERPYDLPKGVEPIYLPEPMRTSVEADNGRMTNAMRQGKVG